MFRAVAGALVKSVQRDLAGYAAIKTNNFLLFIGLLVWGAVRSGVEPASSYPFLLLLGGLMLCPASGDPLEKIPRVRLALWPLGRAARAGLRVGSLALSPVFWLMVTLLSLRAPVGIVLGFIAAVVAMRCGAGFRSAHGRAWADRKSAPLVTKSFRQMFTVLDTYLALVIGAGGGAWRLFAGHPDPAAFPILSSVAAIALSTYAQCLFSLEGESGMTRYRLVPVRGWRIVLAKDAAFLGVLLLAVLPLSPAPGLAFGLAALALGRYPSLRVQLPVERWRFTNGRVLWGVLQLIVGGILGFAAAQNALVPLCAAVALYALSLWWAGREWDRRDRRPQ